jgi:hypothetical protein
MATVAMPETETLIAENQSMVAHRGIQDEPVVSVLRSGVARQSLFLICRGVVVSS